MSMMARSDGSCDHDVYEEYGLWGVQIIAAFSKVLEQDDFGLYFWFSH